MEEIIKELWELDKKHFEEQEKSEKSEKNCKKLFAKDILNDKTYLSGYIMDKIEILGEQGIIEIINKYEE
ncbi:hypothetical protein J5751_04985 [bacterium]|nr:hypothetical protein [bacterium]